jgi:hypothetical protein
LQIVESRFLSQKTRFVAARVDSHCPSRITTAAQRFTCGIQLALVDKILCLFGYSRESWWTVPEFFYFRAELQQFIRFRIQTLRNILFWNAGFAELDENRPQRRNLDTFFASNLSHKFLQLFVNWCGDLPRDLLCVGVNSHRRLDIDVMA